MTSKNFLIDCKALIFNERNQILLVKEPEHWETPGGRLKEAETPLECIIREISEELGAKVEIINKLPIFIRKKTKNENRIIDVLVIYFFGKLLTLPELKKQKMGREKIVEIGWFTSNDIRNIQLNKAEEARLPQILKNLGRH
jgi:ADP-ribose pyrophosphatase YjhB (NUDIX family)